MKEKHRKSRNKDKTNKKRKRNASSSSNDSDEWVEIESSQSKNKKTEREDWMAMTGILKTYTKDDVHPKKEDKDKKHINSYNPSTSSRELNPYWKDGGSGLPQTAENFRQSRQFIKPSNDDEDYYTKSRDIKSSSYSREKAKQCLLNDCDINYKQSRSDESSFKRDDKLIQCQKHMDKDNYCRKSSSETKSVTKNKSRQFLKPSDDDDDNYYSKNSSRDSKRQGKRKDNDSHRTYDDRKSYNWKKGDSFEKTTADSSGDSKSDNVQEITKYINKQEASANSKLPETSAKPMKYLSDEKMNKLAAKIVKAEIMNDIKLVAELQEKLEAAREYRKQNPDAKPNEEDEAVMLIATNSYGNSRPLTNISKGDARSKGGKRKADTHMHGERAKYFGNDDKYNLAQMFENEKYGNNYNDDAELARIASKSKNPNDDLEDIFMDEISKNSNEAKDKESEKYRAIKQHIKMEKSLEGCEYCVDSKNMLKHLMVSCGTKVYVAVPVRKSLVKDHCLISTIQHATSVTALDEDVWEEIMNYRKALTQFFNSQNKDVVFYETATRLHRFPHMVINCVPLPRDVGDMAAIYFKKALLECEAEWSMNKKVVDLKGKNIRKGVPKGLPYFWIDFGMDPGFAHVIEDQQLFPKTFAEEIIAGILDLDHSHWKNPKKEFGDLQRKKVSDFIKEWKPFDIKNKVALQ